MAKPLQGGIAKLVLKGMKAAKLANPITLVKVTPSIRIPGSAAGGTNPTTASYAAQGFIDDYSAYELAGTEISTGDRKVILYGSSIAGGQVPSPDDKAIDETTGKTYRIVTVKSDPASAVYTCQARGAATG